MFNHVLIIIISILLTACGGGGGGGAAPSDEGGASQPAPTPSPSPTPNPPPPPATGSTVTLTWTPPTSRQNGDSLSMAEIGGFEVYYFADGTPSGSGTVVNINDPLSTSYTTPVLSSGIWYFSLAVYDINGVYSDFSTPSAITLP